MGNTVPLLRYVVSLIIWKQTEVVAEEDQHQKQNEVENNFCYFCNISFGAHGEVIAYMGDKQLDRFQHIQQEDAF